VWVVGVSLGVGVSVGVGVGVGVGVVEGVGPSLELADLVVSWRRRRRAR
jgi:hypothetical protein